MIDNVEPNPGQQRHAVINFGLIDVRSTVYETALIHDVISDHHLELAAVAETCVFSDEPNVIKLDIAPAGYRALHAGRGPSANTHRGGGVAIIHR